jgi:putative transposase
MREEFTGTLLKMGVQISMDGRGRALDNVFIERLWRSVKQEGVYRRGYAGSRACRGGLYRHVHLYNQ